MPESAQVPLNGSQPMVGSREEQLELVTTSKELYEIAAGRPGGDDSPAEPTR